MAKYFFQEDTPEQRIKNLADNAEKILNNFSWNKQLDETDMEEFRVKFSEKSIELTDMQNDLKAKTKIAKAEMKPVEQDVNVLQHAIKHRELNIVETVYMMPDQILNKMEYVNEEGLIVFSRPLRPEEKQFSIRRSTGGL